jgi:hypothetical protein
MKSAILIPQAAEINRRGNSTFKTKSRTIPAECRTHPLQSRDWFWRVARCACDFEEHRGEGLRMMVAGSI